MTRGRLTATAVHLAWYIERDGATIVDYRPDGGQLVRVPLGAGGHVDYDVPADMVDDLNRERDVVYARLQAKRRARPAVDETA